MPILFHCPHCNHETHVADSFAGQSGPCAGCGRTILVPTPDYLQRVGPQVLPTRKIIKPSTILLITSGFLFGLLAILAAFLVARNYVSSPQIGNRKATAACQENITQIVAALQSYQATHGHYPPAYTVDPNTLTPLHSWRVLILPHLGEEDLYSQIDLSEPWDSPANRTFHTQMPDVYHCPAHSNLSGAFTHYVVVEGTGFLFDGAKTVTPADIIDDPAETIAIVEVANSNVNWMSPTDLHDSNAGYHIGSDPTAISSLHGENAVNVGFLDGRSRLLFRRDISESQFRAKMTIAGND
ncbi:MAG: DUF1559 domain-containing protein [Pirellulales bacterium]|nr:DUF1559 domain-containing protein [Pirellulales bacterium]